MGSPLAILVVGALGLGAMWRLTARPPASVQSFRRLARRQGFALQQPLSERLARRAPLVRRVQEAASLQRLLAIAGRSETPAAWGFRVLGWSLLSTVGLLCLDLASWVASGQLAVAPGLCFAFGLACLALGYIRLRNAALRRQRGLETAVTGAFTELAILTYTRQLPIEAALEDLVAQCQVGGHLRALFQDAHWRRLVQHDSVGLPGFDRRLLASHTAIYEAIASSLGVPAFHILAGSMRRINDKGQTPAEVLTYLARAVAESQLGEMLVRSEQARARQALPVGLMVIPLLLLLGFPLVAALERVFS
jgi:hypothetical protein